MSDPAAIRSQREASSPAQLRELVEQRLRSVWGDEPHALAGLVSALDYSLLAPGKRVRPVLVLAAAECCGVAAPAIADIAAAFELVHAYSLVHDDLPCMDDDDLRRGIPTSHVRHGEGVAVLVGDALQAEAFRLVAGCDEVAPAARLEVVRLLAEAAGWRGMVGGQYLDIVGERHADDEPGLRDLHDRKTGALIRAAVESGAVVGGVDAAGRAAFARFGRELGWLFQLVDDLLDEVGDSQVTGKSAGTDARHGKVTALAVYGVDGARAAAQRQLEHCVALASALPDGGGALPEIARFVHGRDR